MLSHVDSCLELIEAYSKLGGKLEHTNAASYRDTLLFVQKAKKIKKGKKKKPALGLESFDVAVDFPLGDLCAVEVPFSAFFTQEIFECGFAQCLTH